MMMSAESDGEAVLAGMPSRDRKDCGDIVDSVSAGFVFGKTERIGIRKILTGFLNCRNYV
jgi:hypothetical protein